MRKVKVSINKLPRNGFTNIDPCPDIPDKYEDVFDVIHADFRNLDKVIYDSECDEIIIEDIVDFIPEPNLYDHIECWTKKLRHNGQITITGTDLEETIKCYTSGRMGISDINLEIYGACNSTWSFKGGLTTLGYVTKVLKGHNLKIRYKNLNDNKFMVIARRG
jgi:hypothetical protein